MKLKRLASAQVCIAAVLSDNGECAAEEFLATGGNFAANCRGMRALIARASRGEPLTAANFHPAGDGILEFIKGSLRLLCFRGEGNTFVVCTHGYVKKSQKADRTEVARAQAAMRDYWAAVEAGNIEYIEEDDETHE